MTSLFEAAGLEEGAPTPLAELLRPKSLEEVIGQDHIVGPDGPIGRMVAAGRLASIILWGPPGTGPTTIARLEWVVGVALTMNMSDPILVM